MIKESKKEALFRGIITIILCIFAVFTFIPLMSVIALAFSSKAAADMNVVSLWPVGFTIESWKYLLSDSGLWKALWNTVFATLTGTIISLMITALMAYPLSKEKFKAAPILMKFVIITMIFKAPVVPYFLTVKSMGLLNNIWVLILPHIFTAFNMAIMRTFFKQLPAEIEEAAMIDGCGPFRTLLMIVLPASKAVMATVGLFCAVGIWNQYQNPLMFINDSSLFPLQMKIKMIISGSADSLDAIADISNNYTPETVSAAAIIFTIIPVILVYPWLQKYFAKGALLGSVKG